MQPANAPRPDAVLALSHAALARLVDLARHAGRAILECGPAAAEIKPDGSPVTGADRRASDIICQSLAAWDAAVPIVSEESPLPDVETRRAWTRYWLVDPLDGTKEFLAGRPDYTVNIALIQAGAPVLGVVHAPALSATYWAGRGLGTWKQVEDAAPVRLCVKAPDPAAGCRIVESRSHPSPDLEAFVRTMAVTARVQVGSSLKFCWLCDGRADCYPRFGPTMAWDVAAGDCLFRNACAGETPHPSPLSYDPVDFRQQPFVIGFPPAAAPAPAPERPAGVRPASHAVSDDASCAEDTADVLSVQAVPLGMRCRALVGPPPGRWGRT
jgi:3'(2'), 5'-bisphosphate nucleotidase